MNELTSMLVPLETLPGWPPVANPSPLVTLGLLIGLPVLVIVIVFAIAKIGNAAKAARAGTGEPTDSVWVGGPTRPEIEGPLHDQAALETGEDLIETAELDESGAAADHERDDAGTGGAGARW